MTTPMADTYLCPSCDRLVPVGQNCPCTRRKTKKKKEKGPPTHKPWEQDESRDGLDLPDDSFDYDEFVAREFGTGKPHAQVGLSRFWWLTALVLCLVWFLFYLF